MSQRTAGSLMSDNPAGQQHGLHAFVGRRDRYCEICGKSDRWWLHFDSAGVPVVPPVGLPQEDTHGGAPSTEHSARWWVGRFAFEVTFTADTADEALAVMQDAERQRYFPTPTRWLRLSDVRSGGIAPASAPSADASETDSLALAEIRARVEARGSLAYGYGARHVVPWLLDYIAAAKRHIAALQDPERALRQVPAVPAGGQPAPSEPEVPPGDGRAAGAPLEGIGPSGSLDAGGQLQQGEEAPGVAPAAKDAALRADAGEALSVMREALHAADGLLYRLSRWDVLNLTAGVHDDGPFWQREISDVRAKLSLTVPAMNRVLSALQAAPAVLARADSGGPTTTPAAEAVREFIKSRGMTNAAFAALADVDVLVGALERAEQRAARAEHFIECADTPLMRDVMGQRDELRVLVTEAYPGEWPTNDWRERAEKLGAWPPVLAGSPDTPDGRETS